MDQPRQPTSNLTFQQQVGSDMAFSASYLGSHSDHLWNVVSLNEGVFIPGGPCTLQTPTGPQTFTPCTSTASLDARRRLRLENFDQGKYLGAVDLHTALGRQNYNGLLLSVQRRSATGVTVNANYTLAKCM